MLVSSLAHSLENPAPTTDLAGRPIALALVKAEDLSSANWPNEDVRLVVETALVNADGNIYGLLQANDIAPDTEAFTVVYDLNPMLRDLKTLEPRTTLQLPKVVGGPGLQEMLNHGYLVMLTVDPKLREELNHSAEALQQAVAHFSLLPVERFPSTAESQSAKNKVESLGKWYGQIEKSFLRRTGPPLRRESLLQLQSEADQLNSLLEQVIQSNRRLSTADLDQIAAIHDDVELEMAKYGQVLANEAPKADALYKVVVNIKGDNAALIGNLRVHYMINGLWEPPVNPAPTGSTFGHLGSGESEFLAVQNYKFWAALDGDPGRPLTPPIRVEVRPWKGEVQSVDLSLDLRNPR
jgi:hypothetical protein